MSFVYESVPPYFVYIEKAQGLDYYNIYVLYNYLRNLTIIT